ncbi:hypothetical protein V6N13_100519 [Hibiscus sabdariffa]
MMDQQEVGGRLERPKGHLGHKRDWGLGTTLFIENIPRRMQWKGSWHLFARHGEVNRAFIAKKLSRGGKRFGFVSFGMESDASRAMERLIGFDVYGYRLTVKLTNHNINKWRASGKQYRDQINKGEVGPQQLRNNQILRDMNQRELGGEDANRVLNSERATILITTGYSRRIDETVLVEIGSETHEISILELGFKDDTVDPLTQATNAKASMKPQSEDSSESCSESEQEQTSNSGKEMSKGGMERESLNEMGAEKEDMECFEQPFGSGI